MIIVNLAGGLGNQMFQYAVGRHLSIHFKTDLAIDLSDLNDRTYRPNFTYRNFELGVFDINLKIIQAEQINKFFLKPKSKIQSFLGKVNRFIFNFKSVYESNPRYSCNIIEAGKNCYLNGFWQNETFFLPISEQIRKDFNFPVDLKFKHKLIITELTNNESVAVHIRRGDYIKDEVIKSIYTSFNFEYYYKAIQFLGQKYNKIHFYFFSDEPDWLLENIKIDYPYTFMPRAEAIEDLMLMSTCKHNIIANSSFSWWGAWLNSNPHKIVIAPEKWFANSNKNIACKDWLKF